MATTPVRLSPYKINKSERLIAKAAFERVGRLSEPHKMPCYSYNLPPTACRMGNKLKDIPNSICANCYARRGHYAIPEVRLASERRLKTLEADLPNNLDNWVADMIITIAHYEKSGYFRWHDSGDLQGEVHLDAICRIARALPYIRFWLPTREYAIVRSYLEKGNTFPPNLTVRLSAHFPDTEVPKIFGLPTGTVSKDKPGVGNLCHASRTGGSCGPCRQCWFRDVDNVDYAFNSGGSKHKQKKTA